MKSVKALKRGDTIGIVAPSKKPTSEQKEFAQNFVFCMKELGLNVVFSPDFNKSDEFCVSSSSPEERAGHINDMFGDSNINAIWLFQGGKTANELLPYLDWDLISSNPKIIIGKSDCDLLLLAISKKCDFYTFHGCDAKFGNKREFDYEYTRQFFEERLMKGGQEIVPYFPWKYLREGSCSGEIVGCNPKSIIRLLGTPFFPDFDKKILFLEGYCPEISKVIAMITQLKQLGVFDKISGLVIGHVFEFDSGDAGAHVTYEDVVFSLLKEYSFPVLKIDEFGHYFPHAFIPIGAKVSFNSSKAMKIEILDKVVEVE